jgi:hypothetical protein
VEWNGRWMGTRGRDQTASLKMGERALDGASGESGSAGDRLMRCSDGPGGMLGRLPIEVKVNNEGSGAAVMADQVGQKAIEQVRVESYLCHRLL